MPPMGGRGDRIRTRDLRFWRPLLYQLSYTPTRITIIPSPRRRNPRLIKTRRRRSGHGIRKSRGVPFATWVCRHTRRPNHDRIPASPPGFHRFPTTPRRRSGKKPTVIVAMGEAIYPGATSDFACRRFASRERKELHCILKTVSFRTASAPCCLWRQKA